MAETFSDQYAFVGPSVPAVTAAQREKKRPLVYISLGTVMNRNPAFYRNCFAALGDMDVDVVLSTGGDNDAIQTADDLAGKVIATGAGSTNETATLAWIEETGNGATVRAYDGPQQARTDTQLGRTDGYASPISSISAMIAVQDVDMRIVSEFLTFEQTRFPFAETERGRQLAADISGALDEMEEDGTLTDISAKYFDDDLTVPTEDHMVPDPYSGTFPGGAE